MSWKRSAFIFLCLCGYSSAQLSQNTIIIMPRTDLSATGNLIFRDASGAAKTVTINDPLALTNSYTLTLPLDKGTATQALVISSIVGSVVQLGWGSGGTGGVCGSDQEVQYNDLGVCGADANFLWDYTNKKLTVKGEIFSAGTAGSKLGDAAAPWPDAYVNDLHIISGGSSPQIDASTLAAALNINGSNSSNGNIALNAGLVSGSNIAAVVASSGDKSSAALIAKAASAGTVTNGNGVFQVQDSAGTVHFQILAHGDADPDAAIFGGGAYPGTSATYDIGKSSTALWRDAYLSRNLHFGTTLTISNGSPQIDATSLGAAFQINGSNSTNGNIALNAGNVASTASVVASTARRDAPALIAKDGTNGTVVNGTGVFQVQDSSGSVHFQIQNHGDAEPDAAIFGGKALPGTNSTLDIGKASTARWHDLYLVGKISSDTGSLTVTVPNSGQSLTINSGGSMLFTVATGQLQMNGNTGFTGNVNCGPAGNPGVGGINVVNGIVIGVGNGTSACN